MIDLVSQIVTVLRYVHEFQRLFHGLMASSLLIHYLSNRFKAYWESLELSCFCFGGGGGGGARWLSHLPFFKKWVKPIRES